MNGHLLSMLVALVHFGANHSDLIGRPRVLPDCNQNSEETTQTTDSGLEPSGAADATGPGDSEGGSEEEGATDTTEGEDIGCHNELLYSYGILNAGLTDRESRLCMDAKRSSCCSPTSEEVVMNFWKNNNKLKIKQYIEGYLWVFRALLNYYSQYIAKAKAINDYPSSPSVCKDAASHLLDNFIVKADIEQFMDKLTKMYEHLANIRKGSMLCLKSISSCARDD